MVNNNQRFKKTKIALAVVLTMGLTACGVDGDEGSVSNTVSQSETEATQNVVADQKLTGTVTGAVFDTNGNPIVGAMVYLGTQQTTTSAGGIYVFNDVAVVNVVGVNSETNTVNEDNLAASLPVTIVVDGYLGGTVYVSPQAQVNNTGDGSATTVQTFVEGFTADAGTAVLPALTAKITGRLNDCAIDTDGDGFHEDPAVGVEVSFEVTDLSLSVTVDAPTVGSLLVLAVAEQFTATTDADGVFTAMVPADVTGNVLLEGWHLKAQADTNPVLSGFETEYDSVSTNIGTFEVCAVDLSSSEGNAAPMFASIDGATGESNAIFNDDNGQDTDGASGVDKASFATLGEGVVNDFVVRFTEALPNLTMDDTRLYLNGGVQSPASYTAELSATMDFITITFGEDLSAGDEVEIVIAQWLATDADGAAFEDNDSNSVHWDSAPVSTTRLTAYDSGNALYASARFVTFEKADPISEDASITLDGQVIDATADTDGGSSKLGMYSSAFADNQDGSAVIKQLNGQLETEARLAALAYALDDTVAVAVTVTHNEAFVTYSNASGDVEADVGVGIELSGTSGDFAVTGAVDGDVVEATATNAYGVELATSSVTLLDKIAPTTILQESYNITGAGAPKVLTGKLVVVDGDDAIVLGNGGENTGVLAATEAEVGNPLIFVQPRHLAGSNAGVTGAVRGTEFDGLTEDMTSRLDTGEVVVDGAPDAGDTMRVYDGRPIYDAGAYANWSAVAQDLGVAVSEDIAIVTDSTVTFGGTTAITAPKALLDVALNIDNQGLTDVDLVQISVADVVALANNDHNATLSFAGVIADTSDTANVADADSKAVVVFKDAFPPMVESARWDGTELTVVFNEAIETITDDTHRLVLINPVDDSKENIVLLSSADADTANAFVQSLDKTILTITTDSIISWVGDADVATEDEWMYDDDAAGDTGEEQHAILNWDEIEDANGNSWDQFNGGDADSGLDGDYTSNNDIQVNYERWEVNAPMFVAVNELGNLSVSFDLDANSFTAGIGDTTIVVEFTSTHALNLNDMFDGSIAGVVNANVDSVTGDVYSGAEVEAMLDYTFTSTATIDQSSSTATINGDRTVITFNLTLSAGGADTLDTIDLDSLTTTDTAVDEFGRTDTFGAITLPAAP